MLIAGAHLNLGRASSITGHTAERHQKHFKAAAAIVFGPERTAATEKLIEFEQIAQLDRAQLQRLGQQSTERGLEKLNGPAS